MTTQEVRKTVEQQLQLLSDRSQGSITRQELVALTGAVLDCAGWLLNHPNVGPSDHKELAATIRDTLREFGKSPTTQQQPDHQVKETGSQQDAQKVE